MNRGPSRRELVRSFFDRADNHRAAAHVTRLRARIVRELLRWPPPNANELHVVDVGAGDGSVTLDLASGAASLTWIDVAPEMLAAARATIPPALQGRVRVVDSDLESFAGSFDVVVCVGVLAHVDDVSSTLEKLASVTRAGGRALIELTDGAKLSALPARIAHRIRETVAPRYGYAMNPLRLAEVDALARANGLERIDERRYWSTPPIMRRFASPITQATFERITLERPSIGQFGSSVIALYEKRKGQAQGQGQGGKGVA